MAVIIEVGNNIIQSINIKKSFLKLNEFSNVEILVDRKIFDKTFDEHERIMLNQLISGHISLCTYFNSNKSYKTTAVLDGQHIKLIKEDYNRKKEIKLYIIPIKSFIN